MGDDLLRDRPGPGSDEFDPKQHIWDGRDWWTSDRGFWWDGVQWQPHEVHRVEVSAGPPSATALAHRRDFWIGFTGWFALNVVVFIVLTQLPQGAQQLAGAVLLVVNVMALIILALVRGHAALGMLTALATVFGAVVLAGVFFTAGDFAAAGTGGGGAILVWLLGAVLIPVGAYFILRAIHRSIR